MFDPDIYCSSEMTTQVPFDTSLWAAPMSWYIGKDKRNKLREYQNKGHKEKVIASRRKKSKAAKKARKKNR